MNGAATIPHAPGGARVPGRARLPRALGWLLALLRRDDVAARAQAAANAQGAAEPAPPGEAPRDPAALVDALYQQHAPAVLGYLYHRLPSLPDAEDALADVFVAALRAYATSAVPDLPWLLVVARRRTADFYRSRRKEEHLRDHSLAVTAGEHGDPEGLALGAEQRRELWALVAQLPKEQREVLALRFAAGLRTPAIAAILGKSDEAIRAQLSRAVRRLRRERER